MKLSLRSRVERELDTAASWYEERQQGLRRRFLEAVDESLHRVARYPESYQVVHLDVRRAPVDGFPYSVFYFLLSDRIEVIAVVHDARHPAVWKRRRK